MLSRSASDRAGGRLVLRGLYPISDADAAEKAGLNPTDCCLAMLSADLPLVQLRAKGRSSAELSDILEGVVRQAATGCSRLIVNDRADLAELHGAVGVHVGQEDLSVTELQEHFPRLLCGVSTHNSIQLKEQLALRPDYVALGPLYPTISKRNAEPVLGAAALHSAAQSTRRAGIPLVAIGGINEETLVDAARSAEMVALISLVFPPPGTQRPYSWMEKRCRELNRLVLAQALVDPGE